jgi:hypothetical protein
VCVCFDLARAPFSQEKRRLALSEVVRMDRIYLHGQSVYASSIVQERGAAVSPPCPQTTHRLLGLGYFCLAPPPPLSLSALSLRG